jgi:hypothetical protein
MNSIYREDREKSYRSIRFYVFAVVATVQPKVVAACHRFIAALCSFALLTKVIVAQTMSSFQVGFD